MLTKILCSIWLHRWQKVPAYFFSMRKCKWCGREEGLYTYFNGGYDGWYVDQWLTEEDIRKENYGRENCN